MAIIKIKDFVKESDFAGSRTSGERVREIIEKNLEKNISITLDFSQITMITQSFGDEIVGILTRINGIELIKTNIRLINYNEDIKNILNYVVKYSNTFYKKEILPLL